MKYRLCLRGRHCAGMWKLLRNQVDGTHHEVVGENHRSIIRQIVELDDIQFEFRKDNSTPKPIFVLRIQQEKYRERK